MQVSSIWRSLLEIQAGRYRRFSPGWSRGSMKEGSAREFEGLVQGNKEGITSFSDCFSVASNAYKILKKLTENQELKNFITKISVGDQKQLKLLKIKSECIEDVFDVIETFESWHRSVNFNTTYLNRFNMQNKKKGLQRRVEVKPGSFQGATQEGWTLPRGLFFVWRETKAKLQRRWIILMGDMMPGKNTTFRWLRLRSDWNLRLGLCHSCWTLNRTRQSQAQSLKTWTRSSFFSGADSYGTSTEAGTLSIKLISDPCKNSLKSTYCGWC